MTGTRVSLEVVRVAHPCPNDWGAMSGDERSRYCAGCGLHVHNLSAMTRDEAERLVCEAAGRLCVRYEQTPAGGVRTLEYAAGGAAKRSWRFWTALGAFGAVAAAAMNLFVPRSTGVVTGTPVVGAFPTPAPVLAPPQPFGPAAPDEAGGGFPPVMGEIWPAEPVMEIGPAGPPAPTNTD